MAGRTSADVAGRVPAGQQYDLFIGETGNLNSQILFRVADSVKKTTDFSAITPINDLHVCAAGSTATTKGM
jgi:hypothetical protein